MLENQFTNDEVGSDRRKYPRYDVMKRVSLAVEDESLGESIGIGEAIDLSLGGLRLHHLPAHTGVRLGDKLGLLLISDDQALSLRGEVVHHGTADSFGVEFYDMPIEEQLRVESLLQHLHS